MEPRLFTVVVTKVEVFEILAYDGFEAENHADVHSGSFEPWKRFEYINKVDYVTHKAVAFEKGRRSSQD